MSVFVIVFQGKAIINIRPKILLCLVVLALLFKGYMEAFLDSTLSLNILLVIVRISDQ